MFASYYFLNMILKKLQKKQYKKKFFVKKNKINTVVFFKNWVVFRINTSHFFFFKFPSFERKNNFLISQNKNLLFDWFFFVINSFKQLRKNLNEKN